jgi:putative ABC transport system permease protein
MMTGQILAGMPPYEAAKYQILVLFLLAGAAGLGALAATHVAVRRISDDRHRLRLDRLAQRCRSRRSSRRDTLQSRESSNRIRL